MIELQHDSAPLSILLDVMYAASISSNLQSAAEYVLDRILTHPAFDGGGIWLAEQGTISCLAQRGLEIMSAEALAARVYAFGAPEESELSGRPPADHQKRALFGLPLAVDRGTIGALVLGTKGDVAGDDRLVVQAIARHLAVVIQYVKLTQLVEQQRAQLDAPNRQWDEFLSLASHELKNPLASIKGYADLMLRRASKDPADPNRKGLEVISQQVGRTTALLEEMLDLSRIGTNRLRLVQRETDLAPIVQQAIQGAQRTTEQHHISLDQLDTALVGSFDGARVRQVIDTMLGNAIRYSPNGGPVAVQVRRVAGTVEPEALVAISDWGIGIPANELRQVFARFFRASNVRGTFAGMGLGLFIACEIAKMHGGRMWIESAVGRGTTCYLALPLAADG